jgi:hypothetical protein
MSDKKEENGKEEKTETKKEQIDPAKMWRWRYDHATEVIKKLYDFMSNFHIDAEDIDEVIKSLGICPNHYVDPDCEEDYDETDRICTCCCFCWKDTDKCECSDRCKVCKGYAEKCTCDES